MFDFVRLPNPIERLEFDWVRSVFCSILFDWIGRVYGLSTGPQKKKKSGRCGGVAVSGGSTVSILNGITIPVPLRQSCPQECAHF